MKVDTTKSKNAENFYIRQSYVNLEGKSTSKTIRKLGTLNELLAEHGPTRDDVMRWAKEQARVETEKYKAQKDIKSVLIPFRADKKIEYDQEKRFQGGVPVFTIHLLWSWTKPCMQKDPGPASV